MQWWANVIWIWIGLEFFDIVDLDLDFRCFRMVDFDLNMAGFGFEDDKSTSSMPIWFSNLDLVIWI